MTALERVTGALERATGYHPPGHGNWRCPAHEDGTASLALSNGAGKVLIHCHAGCDLGAVLEALDLQSADLFDEPPADRPVIGATYDYVDEAGTLLFQTVRMVPKDFRQRRPAPGGGWDWRLGDVRRVLYRLPSLVEAVKTGQRVWVVEGEKDVHAIEAAGEVATCSPMGAGKWRRDYAEALAGAEVIIVADRDTPGRKHAIDVNASLAGKAHSVVVVEAVEGKDAADHLAGGRSLEELVANRVDLTAQLAEDLAVLAPADSEPAKLLEFVTAAQLAAEVDQAPPIGWLCRPIWPADAYGVVGAEQKAGKTWGGLDLAVSVASGSPWLDEYPVERPGPVVVFLGEGGKRKMLRRLRAICEHKRVAFEELPVHLCFRVPYLGNVVHLGEIADKLTELRPALVVVDPLYLAARGAKFASLSDVGEHLEAVQVLCQAAGAALVIVHHWNQTGVGRGAERFSGAGAAEWGRVLASVEVIHKHTDPATKASTVTLGWQFSGDEIPDLEMRLVRKVWADDPDDLASPLHYELRRGVDQAGVDPELAGLRPAHRRVLAVLEAGADWLDASQIGDRIAEDDSGMAPLRRRTIQEAGKALVEADLAECRDRLGTNAYEWRSRRAQPAKEGDGNAA